MRPGVCASLLLTLKSTAQEFQGDIAAGGCDYQCAVFPLDCLVSAEAQEIFADSLTLMNSQSWAGVSI